MGYSREEQETTIVFYEGRYQVYCTYPKHIRKLMEIGDMEVLEEEDGKPIAIKGYLDEGNISFRKPKQLTENQRKVIAERLMNGRKR